MRVLIATDIEGVAGVFAPEQTRAGNAEYERARLLMAGEANAAIAGAFDAGATAVLVNDSHGSYRNLPADRLDERASQVLGKPRTLGMMAGIDEAVDAVCLVGFHSRAGGRGVLAHTINSFAFSRVRFNDREVSEAVIYGALAGERGIPVVMASGDDVFVAEHRGDFPHAELVEVKRAGSANSGISLSPASACAAIRAGVATGLARLGTARPFMVETPIAVRVRTTTAALADLFSQWPSLARLAVDEIGFEASDAETAARMLNCLSAMSAVLR